LKVDEKPRIKTMTKEICTGQEKVKIKINSPFGGHVIIIQ